MNRRNVIPGQAPDYTIGLNQTDRVMLVSLPVLDGEGRNVFANVVREGASLVERLNMSCCPVSLLLTLAIGDIIQLETYPIKPAMLTVTVVTPATADSTARASALNAATQA